jgi:benzoyl-CoA reductase/2-hydroxyglutaryl-CoA dehydratase subunit BcrC/BadD/HgdB
MSTKAHIEKLREVIAGPTNRHIQAWKDPGRGVIGYFCSYVPVELIMAAGLLPVRLRGAGSTDSGPADAYLSARVCTYVRHTLTLALSGRYDYLDGEIGLNSCDHVRRAFDLWRHKTKVPFHGFVSVPRNVRDSLFPYYKEEIENLKAAIEKHFSKVIGDDDLKSAISKQNQVKQRLQRIDELRGMEIPGLSGAEALTATIASFVMPAEDFIQAADELIAEAGKQEAGKKKPRARLLLAGGELDEPGFVEAIESQGALVAADSLCFGTRAFPGTVAEDADDPLDALSQRYFFQTPCARMIGNFPERFDAIMEAIEERKIDGVVVQRLKFCDPWGAEAHKLRLRCKRVGVPLLVLEREYGLVHAGQVRTRVQAFLEMISAANRKGRAQARARARAR